MHFKTLEHVHPEVIRNTLNLAFSDYLVPFQLSPAQFDLKLKSDRINLAKSVGAFETADSGEAMLGLILHGEDTINGKPVLYNAATGVIPDKRGQQLCKKMMEFLQNQLSETVQFQLEVIEENRKAIHIYRDLGFKSERMLECFKGSIKPNLPELGYTVEMVEFPEYSEIENFADWQPAWGNSYQAIQTLKQQNITLGIKKDHKLVAYLNYNPVSNRVQQFAVDPKWRRKGMATALFSTLANDFTKDLVVLNVDADSESTIAFLKSIGLQFFISQHEMLM